MGKNVAVLVGLLILGVILAVVIWLLVFLPFKVVQPIDFIPLQISEETTETLPERVDGFLHGQSTSIDMTREDIGLLIQRGLEEQLGMEITALSVDFSEDHITTIIKVRISDIPSGGYLTWMLTRRSAEHTTTLISARVWAQGGAVAYDLLDFRIGKFRIPGILVRRLIREDARAIGGAYIQDIQFFDDYIRITRN